MLPAEVTIQPTGIRDKTVARDRNKPEKGLRQVNIRLDEEYHARVERAADLLGLDVAQLLRMIIRENFPSYEARSRLLEQPGVDEGADPSAPR